MDLLLKNNYQVIGNEHGNSLNMKIRKLIFESIYINLKDYYIFTVFSESMSMTTGTAANTRLSTAATVQVVQPKKKRKEKL